jgi:hypothetical protein
MLLLLTHEFTHAFPQQQHRPLAIQHATSVMSFMADTNRSRTHRHGLFVVHTIR